MKYVFIINPNAGKSSSFFIVKNTIDEYFQNRNQDYVAYETQREKHATEIVRDELSRSGGEKIRFYVAGGDGTVNEVINGIGVNPLAEMGVIPVGSGNDFIKTFGKKEDFLHLENQFNGTVTKVDLIKTTSSYSVNICSVGLDANVCYNVINFKKMPMVNGSLAYDMALAKSLFSKLGQDLKIEIKTKDGLREYGGNYLFALAASGQWYGGGYHGAPRAIANDGLLDFILIKTPSMAKLLGLISIYKKGEHLESPKFKKYLTYIRGTEMKIIGEKPFICNNDGECEKLTEENYKIIPNALNFVLPWGMSYGKNEIETERLVLRNWNDSDGDSFDKIMSSVEIMTTAGAKPVKTREESDARLAEFIRNSDAFAIVIKATGEVIGACKYQEDHRRPLIRSKTLGYEILPEHQNKGYMTEALKALVENAFVKLDLDILGIGHSVDNVKSQRVIEKSGFKLEGIIKKSFKRYDEAEFDEKVYSITKEEFYSDIY